MSNRDAFLARVRQAADQGRQYRVHLQEVGAEIGYVGAGGDLALRFAEEVNAVGGQAFVVGSVAEARAKLGELLTADKASSAVCWQLELLKRLGVREMLTAAKVDVLDWERLQALAVAEQRQRLLACDVGITSCDMAIAETGTLMMCARPGQERLASLLAPIHIAVVERRQIVPDLIDAFNWLQRGEANDLPCNVTFITGPSKTGDIELQLTTGVHGPGVWQVIIIDEQDNR